MSAEEPVGASAAADLRLVLPAAGAWGGALLGTSSVAAGSAAAGAALLLSAALLARVRRSRSALHVDAAGGPSTAWALTALLACLAAGATAAALRVVALESGPVPALAQERATVSAVATVTSDPRPVQAAGRFGLPRQLVSLDLQLDLVSGRGRTVRLRTPVLAVADRTWSVLLPGSQVRLRGRLAPPTRGGPIAAVLSVRGPPAVLRGPGAVQRATEPFRRSLRQAVADLPAAPRGLVPALVLGDETRMPDELRTDFQLTGLTHLTAVSGANVAIVLAFVTGLARWLGVRGVALPVVGGLAVLAFVALARPEPSVLRAAAMGLVAVAGLSAGGRRRGVAALATAIVVLVLVDPWLARSYGFALSALATAGILLLGPPWRDALARWLPRPVAEAVAVPLAAQVACTPVVAVLSDAVSLSALPANLLAGAAVAPATVLGLVASVVGTVAPVPARWAGWLAGQAARWIVVVAEHASALPGTSLPWRAEGAHLVLLCVLSLAAVGLAPAVLRRRWLALGAAALLVLVLVRPLPRPGWPPPGWVLVACDVGQGDGLALRAGPAAAVVVDAGPDPARIRRCLDDLGVRSVPALVLTHFDADHVVGLPGVLAGRQVGQIVVGPLQDPPPAVAEVHRRAAAAGIPVVLAHAGDEQRTGPLTWRVLWPRYAPPAGSSTNNSALVLRVSTAGTVILLTADVEPPAQAALLAADPGMLHADVLKVPHHGSRFQDPAFLPAVGPRVALVSVGAGNDYGHPAASTLATVAAGGALVGRTDQDGALAVVSDGRGGLSLVRAGSALPAR